MLIAIIVLSVFLVLSILFNLHVMSESLEEVANLKKLISDLRSDREAYDFRINEIKGSLNKVSYTDYNFISDIKRDKDISDRLRGVFVEFYTQPYGVAIDAIKAAYDKFHKLSILLNNSDIKIYKDKPVYSLFIVDHKDKALHEEFDLEQYPRIIEGPEFITIGSYTVDKKIVKDIKIEKGSKLEDINIKEYL